MDDRMIVYYLWNRLEDGLRGLAQRFGARLYATAMHILEDPRDAEEAVSDTYLAVWNAIPPTRPDPLTGFVYKVGRNQALKKLRHRTAGKRDGGYALCLEELAGCIPGPALEDLVDARELGLAIDRYLSTLPRQNRRLFLRRYWFGDSTAELAAEFHLKPNALTVRLSRIRAGLREYLKKEGYDHV